MAKRAAKRRGRGSVREHKNGKFEARITIGYKSSGAAIRRSEYADTRDEAEKALTKLLAAHDDGTLADPSRMTVSECLERYISNKVNTDESTRYKDACETRPIIEIIGRKRLQDLRPVHVRDAYTELARRDFSVRAQRRAAMHLKAALREAMHDGIVIRNVAEAVKLSLPRVDKEDEAAQAWTPAEVNTFLEAARGEVIKKPTGGKAAKGHPPELIRVPLQDAVPVPLYPVFYLMLALGLRRGEALGLPWKAVDLEAGTVRVMQALSPKGKGGAFVIKPVKTPSSRRTLYLSQDVLELLKAHKAKQKEACAFIGPGWQETGLVFTTSVGTPISPRNALRRFKQLIKPLAVTQIRLHDLRHTHASLALQRGIPVEVVSERLGHARVDITLNIYRHLYDVERQAAALSLTDLLGHSGQEWALN